MALATTLGCTTASATEQPPTDAAQMLDWIDAHRDQAALSVSGTESVELNGAQRRPLASVFKVLVLGAYAEGVAAGRIDPYEPVTVGAVERWYWPHTDGEAHPNAVQEWKTSGVLHGDGPTATVPLDSVARAMTKFSDNAAADYLLHRVGRPAADDFARRHGMRAQDPVQPKFGEYVALTTIPIAAWQAFTPQQRADTAWTLGEATPAAVAATLPLPDVATQSAWLEHGDTQGTADDWRALSTDLFHGTGLSPAARTVLRRHFEWWLEAPAINGVYDRYGSKGGSFATVLNMVGYQRPIGGAEVSYALLLHDLRPELAAALGRPTLAFVQRIGYDPAFAATVRARLG